MADAEMRLVAEPRDGASYVTVLGAGGRRIATGILARPDEVAAFNARPRGADELPTPAHALYLALTQEAQSEHWHGSAADRAWLLNALREVGSSPPDTLAPRGEGEADAGHRTGAGETGR